MGKWIFIFFTAWMFGACSGSLYVTETTSDGQEIIRDENGTIINVQEGKVEHPTEMPPKENVENTNLSEELFVEFRRTSCYGRCPTYNVYVYHDGRATYEGVRFTDRTGKWEAELSDYQMQHIKNLANDHGYFNFEKKYDRGISDVPSCFTTVSFDGRTHSIHNRTDAPELLISFEKRLDDLWEELEWVTTEPTGAPAEE